VSKKHDQNLRYLARLQAFFFVAHEALYQAGSALSQLEVGPSSEGARRVHEKATHALNDLQVEIGKLERTVCS
jgi:hypothetical protein